MLLTECIFISMKILLFYQCTRTYFDVNAICGHQLDAFLLLFNLKYSPNFYEFPVNNSKLNLRVRNLDL